MNEQTEEQRDDFIVEEQKQDKINSQKIEADNIVKNHVIASITVGLTPIPLFDLAALSMTQMSLLKSLSGLYDVSFDEKNSKSLITSLIGGSLPVMGVIGLSSFAKLIPGIGSLAGSASLSLSAGAVSYGVGQVFIMHFEQGGTLENFDAKQAQAFFKREVDKGKTFIKTLKNEINEDGEEHNVIKK